MTIAKRSDFTKIPDASDTPGPGHTDINYQNTISKNSIDNSSKQLECTFRNNYDKYSKICYKGMEQSYYLT